MESQLSDIKLPVILENKELMAPGRWNNSIYTAKEIEKAFKSTDWTDRNNSFLFLDHPPDPNKAAKDWVGTVQNLKCENGKLTGDLVLWDDRTIIKLVQAKAHFGISPALKGEEIDGKMKNFSFENFSIVTRPAVKTAYINLSQKIKGGKMVDEKLLEEGVDEDESEESEEVMEEEEKELAKKKKYPYYPKKEMKKKKYPDEEEEEEKSEKFSEEELKAIFENSEYTDFVKDYLKKHKDASIADAAKAWKSEKEASEALEQLSSEELMGKIDKLMALLKKKKAEYPYPKDEEKEKEMEELKGQVKELQEKLNQPDPKTINLSSSGAKVDVCEGMVGFLQSLVK